MTQDAQDSAPKGLALEARNLSKVFQSDAGKVVALKNVSLTVKKGEFVAIVGPSGSGKSRF